MKYTESIDGVKRATFHIPIRLTPKQYRQLRQMAKEREVTPHTMMEGLASLVIEHEISEWAHENDVISE